MSDLRALLDAPALVLTGWSVVLSLWSTALAALAHGACCILRPRLTATARYRAALASLGAALAISLATPAVLTVAARAVEPPAAAATPAPHPSRRAERQPATTQTDDERLSPVTDLNSVDASTYRWVRRAPPVALGLVGLLWVSGVVIGLARLLGGWVVADRLGTRASLVDDGPIRDRFEHVRGQTHAGLARFAMSFDVEAPVAIGVTSPTVVVPAHLLDHLPPDVLAPILAHELSHVARRDYAVNLAQCVAEVLLFHSPRHVVARAAHS